LTKILAQHHGVQLVVSGAKQATAIWMLVGALAMAESSVA